MAPAVGEEERARRGGVDAGGGGGCAWSSWLVVPPLGEGEHGSGRAGARCVSYGSNGLAYITVKKGEEAANDE